MIALIIYIFSDNVNLPSLLLRFSELINFDKNDKKFIIALLILNIIIFFFKNLYLFFYKIYKKKIKNRILANKSFDLFKGYISVNIFS